MSKSKLSDKVKPFKAPPAEKGPVWKGPEVDGVTQSLLGRFLVCRERFRVLVVEGLKPAEQFNARMEFGNMWHVCEEGLAKQQGTLIAKSDYYWSLCLNEYASGLCDKYRHDQEQIDHWYEVTKALFPLYVAHWAKHPDVQDRTPLLAEQVFDVPYKLPSGRTVRLRGKWDSVDLVGKGKNAGVWLVENKTKSQIDQQKIARQLTFDLQTMMYLVALDVDRPRGMPRVFPIKGVRYNVVRRSAHKSVGSMLKKLEDDRADGRIGEWFSRWNVEVTPADVLRFRRQCLDPILEQLCDWWDHITGAEDYPYPTGIKAAAHWRHPYGVWNIMDEGGVGDVDAYMDTKSEVGLRRVDNLFPELS